MIIHIIEPGETVDSIAELYGVSPDWIIRENGIIDPTDLAIGGALVILTPALTHTIEEGDSLESIAQMYGVTVMSILRNNTIRMTNFDSIAKTTIPAGTHNSSLCNRIHGCSAWGTIVNTTMKSALT